MRFQVHQVDPESDEFADVVACEVDSFENPPQSIFRFFYPIFGDESAHENKTALRNLVELQRQWARDDPDSIWYKAIDTENGNRIVGGLLIKIHKENPFNSLKSKDESAVWYAAGSQRQYIDECLRIFNAPREKFMQRPHVYAYIGFVRPAYRKQGIADLLLAEGCRRADELGIEAYLESVVAMGVPIYMRHNFIPLRELPVKPISNSPDNEWKELEKKMQPLSFWPMWRPPYGKFVSGVTAAPWDGVNKSSKL